MEVQRTLTQGYLALKSRALLTTRLHPSPLSQQYKVFSRRNFRGSILNVQECISILNCVLEIYVLYCKLYLKKEEKKKKIDQCRFYTNI